jgi:hypothetical protein
MNIRILKPFTDPTSPIGFTTDECMSVPDALAATWIKRGDAIALDTTPAQHTPPQKRQRETATR